MIVAMNEARVIGRDGGLPWHLPEDLKHFKKLTSGCPVIMGRKTFESLPAHVRPLPGRRNLIVTRNSSFEAPQGVEVVSSPEAGIRLCRADIGQYKAPIWIIGGAEIYKASLDFVDEIWLTAVPGTDPGDAYFPEFESKFNLVENTPGLACTFKLYRRQTCTRS